MTYVSSLLRENRVMRLNVSKLPSPMIRAQSSLPKSSSKEVTRFITSEVELLLASIIIYFKVIGNKDKKVTNKISREYLSIKYFN